MTRELVSNWHKAHRGFTGSHSHVSHICHVFHSCASSCICVMVQCVLCLQYMAFQCPSSGWGMMCHVVLWVASHIQWHHTLLLTWVVLGITHVRASHVCCCGSASCVWWHRAWLMASNTWGGITHVVSYMWAVSHIRHHVLQYQTCLAAFCMGSGCFSQIRTVSHPWAMCHLLGHHHWVLPCVPPLPPPALSLCSAPSQPFPLRM